MSRSHLTRLSFMPSSIAGLAAAMVLSACGAKPTATEAKAPQAPVAAEAPPPAQPETNPEPEQPARAASDILAGEDKAWVFSFEGSAAYDKAKAACEEKHASDPAARARCITKARDTFTADAMEFTRDDEGNDVWVIYRTRSNKLVKVYSVQIEYGEQAGDTVQIKKLGREQGKPLLFAGVKEFKIKLGGEYSLELEDDKHGLLSYDARLNFIATQ